jgi:hypothetical protein
MSRWLAAIDWAEARRLRRTLPLLEPLLDPMAETAEFSARLLVWETFFLTSFFFRLMVANATSPYSSVV